MVVARILIAAAVAVGAIAADAPASLPAAVPMFTAPQAHAGLAVYTENCAKCHNATLVGGSAPDLFGKSFTASRLSMSGLNREVTNEMPLDNPAGLTPVQYANVIAYLLAANCYPAGSTAYPSDGTIPNRTDKVATQGAVTAPCAAP
jgi:polar amino acid transport system substrate-binding protein